MTTTLPQEAEDFVVGLISQTRYKKYKKRPLIGHDLKIPDDSGRFLPSVAIDL